MVVVAPPPTDGQVIAGTILGIAGIAINAKQETLVSHKFILSVWDLAIIENALREYRDRWSNTLSRRGNRDLDALIANISAARPPIEKNEKDPHNGVAAPGNRGSARDERLPEAMLGNWC